MLCMRPVLKGNTWVLVDQGLGQAGEGFPRRLKFESVRTAATEKLGLGLHGQGDELYPGTCVSKQQISKIRQLR